MRLRKTTYGLRYIAWLTEEEAEVIENMRQRKYEKKARAKSDSQPKCIFSYKTDPQEGCNSAPNGPDGFCGTHRNMRTRWVAEGSGDYFDKHFLKKPKLQE